VREFVRLFSGTVELSGREIAARSTDLATKRLSVAYRSNAIEAARATLMREDARAGGLDLWALCVQLDEFLTVGEGQNVFGEQQPIAVSAIGGLRQQTEAAAVQMVPAEQLAAAKRDVEEFAKRYPITGSFCRVGLNLADLRGADAAGMFSWFPTVSLNVLNPLRGVGSGISEGAAAVYAIGRSADRFADVVEFLPMQLGWQLELMQYGLEDSPPVTTTTAAVDVVAASARDAVSVAREMPASIRAEVEGVLAAIDPQLAGVRATLADLQATGATFGSTAASLEAMARQLDAALVTFQGTVSMLTAPSAKPKDPNAKPGRPFAIAEYGQTAESIGAMAGELAVAIGEVQRLVNDEALTRRVAEVGSSTRSTAGAIVRDAVLGALVVLAAFFGLLLGYRMLASRMARAPRAAPL
jgi:hypothetical protein